MKIEVLKEIYLIENGKSIPGYIVTDGTEAIKISGEDLKEKLKSGELERENKGVLATACTGVEIYLSVREHALMFGTDRDNLRIKFISNIEESKVSKLRALGYIINEHDGHVGKIGKYYIAYSQYEIIVFSYYKLYAYDSFRVRKALKLKSIDFSGLDFLTCESNTAYLMRGCDIEDVRFRNLIVNTLFIDCNFNRVKLGEFIGENQFRFDIWHNTHIGTLDASQCNMDYLIYDRRSLKFKMDRCNIDELIVSRRYKEPFEEIMAGWDSIPVTIRYV